MGLWRRALVICCCGWCLIAAVRASDEEFSEELVLRPLPDGNVLSHFHFSSRLPAAHGQHHRLFPKAIFQLAKKYRIREMELSFTQGRWNYQKWGVAEPVAQVAAKPVGVELSASFDVPQHELDSTWGNLTNALSGLFCASVNFLQSPTTYVDPWLTFANQTSGSLLHEKRTESNRVVTGKRSAKTGVRYGCLPREAVCTENLTPWLKLLPCRDKAGLTTLLDRPTIYSGLYHSLRLVLRSGEFDGKVEAGTTLDQTLTVVLRDSARPWKVSDWSLSTVFGSKLTGSCPLAKTSSVYLEFENGLVQQLVKGVDDRVDYVDNSAFSVKAAPDRILEAEGSSVLLGYDVSRHGELDLGLTWKAPVSWSLSPGPFYVSRFLTGSGNARGSVVIYFQANSGFGGDRGKDVDITVLQMVPWYVRLYGHTLQAHLDGGDVDLWSVVRFMRFTPAEDRKSPAAIELALRVPSATRSLTLTLEFDKGFLHIDEHPPDANRGFDLPAALVTFPGWQIAERFEASSTKSSPFIDALQMRRPLQMYTEVLLLQLATPDFSMPYNVITLTCTVLALYFGSLLNALRRRTGEEERESKSEGWLQRRFKWLKNKKVSRLMKIILVVVIGIAVNHYSDS